MSTQKNHVDPWLDRWLAGLPPGSPGPRTGMRIRKLSDRFPIEVVTINRQGNEQVLAAATTIGTQRFIYFNTEPSGYYLRARNRIVNRAIAAGWKPTKHMGNVNWEGRSYPVVLWTK